MALGVMQIAKLMKGGLDGEQIAEMMGAMGMGAEVTQLTPGQVDPAFRKLWENAQESGGVLLRIELTKKDGEKMSGLLLMHKAAVLPASEPISDERHTLAAQVA